MPMKRPTLVVAEKSGQLGNQLILFSHLIALAQEYQLRVSNPSFADYSRHFAGTHRSLYPVYPFVAQRPSSIGLQRLLFRATNIYARGMRKGYWGGRSRAFIATLGDTPAFDKNLSEPPCLDAIRSNGRTFLFGWRYRNYELFYKHSDIIREFFKPVAHEEVIVPFVNRLREKFDVIVALHIRQGDYETFENGKYYLSTKQYRDIAAGMIEQIGGPRVGVVIFSNVKQDLSIFRPLAVVEGPGEAVTDLYCMALADYIIAVPSTFSRWASFYGKVPLGVVNAQTDRLALSQFAASPH